MEKINLANNSPLARALLENLPSKCEARNVLVADVLLTVQGVPVHLSGVAQALFEMLNADIDARARTMAESMVGEAGLEPVAAALRSSRMKIGEALREAEARLKG